MLSRSSLRWLKLRNKRTLLDLEDRYRLLFLQIIHDDERDLSMSEEEDDDEDENQGSSKEGIPSRQTAKSLLISFKKSLLIDE